MLHKFFATLMVAIIWSGITLSCQEPSEEIDSILMRQLRDFDTVGVKQALAEWRKDSLGCLKLRGRKMANYLLKELDIVNKTPEEIVAVLGTPNETFRRRGLMDDEDQEYLYLDYYYEIHCEDGKPKKLRLGYCWLRICINPETNKVVSTGTPCS